MKLSRFILNRLDKLTAQCQMHEPNSSFSPIRGDIQVDMFVDGAETFTAMAAAMKAAERSIYISDWWLSPEIYLIREPGKPMDPQQQLSDILKRAADRGVEVRVLLWENVEKAVPIRSERSKQVLEGISPNIKVLRHSAGLMTGMYTHHQKILVVYVSSL